MPRLLFAVAAAASIAASAPAQSKVTVELQGGGHVEILSAYLRPGSATAVVSGMVQRERLWAGPAAGHLHVSAYAADGSFLAMRPARWSVPYLTRPAASYHVDLGVPRAAVASLRVTHVPGLHDSWEVFQ